MTTVKENYILSKKIQEEKISERDKKKSVLLRITELCFRQGLTLAVGNDYGVIADEIAKEHKDLYRYIAKDDTFNTYNFIGVFHNWRIWKTFNEVISFCDFDASSVRIIKILTDEESEILSLAESIEKLLKEANLYTPRITEYEPIVSLENLHKWVCEYCKTCNSNNEKKCSYCAAPRRL